MTFHILTIFPRIFSAKGGPVSGGDSCGYFSQSIIKRAIEKGLIKIKIHNLRDYTTDKHRTVDDTPYGGGPGMIMKVAPIFKCLEKIKSEMRNFSKVQFSIQGSISPLSSAETNPNSSKLNLSRVILFSAKGKKYTQSDAKRLKKYGNIILICGRYEGVDERVARYLADEEISIGDYVLTGGEIPAMIVVDSVTRLIPGVLGNIESAKYESFSKKGYIEYPQYTKPSEFRGWKVPEVLLSGNHKEIDKWRKKHGGFSSKRKAQISKLQRKT